MFGCQIMLMMFQSEGCLFLWVVILCMVLLISQVMSGSFMVIQVSIVMLKWLQINNFSGVFIVSELYIVMLFYDIILLEWVGFIRFIFQFRFLVSSWFLLNLRIKWFSSSRLSLVSIGSGSSVVVSYVVFVRVQVSIFCRIECLVLYWFVRCLVYFWVRMVVRNWIFIVMLIMVLLNFSF